MRRPSRKVTQAQIARAAGVSQTAVSLVLGGKGVGAVGEEQRRRVLQTADRLGYSGRLPGKTGNIGVLLPFSHSPDEYIGSPYYGRFVAGLMRECQRRGRHLLLETSSDKRHPPEMVEKGKVDGLIVAAPFPRAYLQKLKRHTPLILLNNMSPEADITSVMPDNSGGAHEVVRTLHDIGHRRIAYLANGIEAITHVRERYEGYAAGLQSVGLEPDERYVWGRKLRDTRPPKGKWPGELAAERLARMPDPPTAVIGQSDIILFPFMKTLQALGWRLPRDCSVIGFDNLTSCDYSDPPLTSVEQPMERMGVTAIRELLRLVDGVEAEPKQIRLPTRLVPRESVAPPPASPKGRRPGRNARRTG